MSEAAHHGPGGLESTASQDIPLRELLPQSFRNWASLSVRLDNLSKDMTSDDIHRWLAAEGTISSLIMIEPENVDSRLAAKVTFHPPPRFLFWRGGSRGGSLSNTEIADLPVHTRIWLTVLDQQPSMHSGPSTIPARTYPSRIILRPELIEFGTMLGPAKMQILNVVRGIDEANLKLEFNTVDGKIIAHFPFTVQYDHQSVTRQYKLIANMFSTNGLYETEDIDGRSLVVSFPYPPQYLWRMPSDLSSVSTNHAQGAIRDPWWRATDISEEPSPVESSPVTLRAEVGRNQINIGRWTTLRFRFRLTNIQSYDDFFDLQEALQELNAGLQLGCSFQESGDAPQSMWEHLDHQPTMAGGNAWALLSAPISFVVTLPFTVRYQLEVCVSRGVLNEYNISVDFLQRLAAMDTRSAGFLLEYLVDQNKPVYDINSIFTNPDANAYEPYGRVPHYCTLVRKVSVTPSTVRFNSATLETSNRVIRKFIHVSDRFLRVQFVEEAESGRIAASASQNDEVWERVRRTLFQGIQVGERKYEFLAFGSSQLRQGGAYFFCPTNHISCDDIRRWMGQFSHIKVVAKYAARLGQCLSTTRGIRGVSVPVIRPIQDIERNGYCFTDGVGRISDFLRAMIIEDMKLDVFDEPSAFQFRMGGCKGVLVVWPQAKGMDVQVRPSQEKFKAEFNGLEIIKCAKFATASLNRQTITILECLGVPTRAFVTLLDQQLNAYEIAMDNNDAAVILLRRFVDENQTSLMIADMLKAGFKTDLVQEPFVLNVLRLWRAWSLKLLKEKARIQVERSAFVLGCVDETQTLRGHSAKSEGSKDKSVDKLPQIFLQITDPHHRGRKRILEGICIVGRNPSLHPGDIRVVQAVNNTKLHHLKDVVVFPSTGDRPVPNMLSGGDLDGDEFFVIWDSNLIPKTWNYPPMNYEGAQPAHLERDVNVDDLKDFFVKYMKNDVLPLIAISHLAYADKFTPDSALCLKLAEKHSEAVDFPKTGEAVAWDMKAMPTVWPHFMEKRNIYRSRKALGVIYDKVVRRAVKFHPDRQHGFDQRILSRFKLDDEALDTARGIKAQYDTAVRRIMTQHKLDNEFELWTSFAMSKPAVGSDYKRQEDLGREYDALKQRFRDICYQAAGVKDPTRNQSQIDPFVAAMYKVTEEEAFADSSENPDRLISFPWIFHKVLIRIAVGGRYEQVAGGQSVNAYATQPVSATAGNAIGHTANDDVGEQNAEMPTTLTDGTLVEMGQPLAIFDANNDQSTAGDEVAHADQQDQDGTIQQPGEEDLGNNGVVEDLGQEETAMDRFTQLMGLDDDE